MATKLAGKVISPKDRLTAEELKAAKDKLIKEQNEARNKRVKRKV
jgi:hypothetical protein